MGSMNAASKTDTDSFGMKDEDALVRMLSYVILEARRLGLSQCAHHAEIALDATYHTKEDRRLGLV